MNKVIGKLSILALLSGCATIVEGSSQDIQLSTTPPANVTCDAQNSRGLWRSNLVPGPLNLERSKSDLVVRCEGREYEGSYVSPSDLEAWAAGNLLFGGIIGGIIDASSGGLFSYDDHINVPVSLKQHVAAEAPKPIYRQNECIVERNGRYYREDLVNCGIIVRWNDDTKHLVTPPTSSYESR